MPLYFFRISNGRYAGASDQGSEFESREAAWAEMTKVCGNLLGSISRSMKQNAEWQMEMLDESKQPVFRIRLVAELVELEPIPTGRWFRLIGLPCVPCTRGPLRTSARCLQDSSTPRPVDLLGGPNSRRFCPVLGNPTGFYARRRAQG